MELLVQQTHEEIFKLIIISNINKWLRNINLDISFYCESSIWSFLDYFEIELDWVYTAWKINSGGNLYYRRGSPESYHGHKLESIMDQSINDFAKAIYAYEMGVNAPSFSKWQYEYDHLISLNHETNKVEWERNVNMMIDYDSRKISEAIKQRYQAHDWFEPIDEEYIQFISGFRGSSTCCVGYHEFYNS